MLSVVQPAMEALTVQLLVLAISICSEFQPTTEKKKKALAMYHTNILFYYIILQIGCSLNLNHLPGFLDLWSCGRS